MLFKTNLGSKFGKKLAKTFRIIQIAKFYNQIFEWNVNAQRSWPDVKSSIIVCIRNIRSISQWQNFMGCGAYTGCNYSKAIQVHAHPAFKVVYAKTSQVRTNSESVTRETVEVIHAFLAPLTTTLGLSQGTQPPAYPHHRQTVQTSRPASFPVHTSWYQLRTSAKAKRWLISCFQM